MNDDSWILDRFHLPLAAGVYFEHSELGIVPPIDSSVRITEDSQVRLTEDGAIRITE